MKKMTRREAAFRQKHLSCVRHMTLDPYGPGVVRMHMIPPREGSADEPFLLLLNGAHLVPLNLSWAILLSNFMDALEPFSGREISQDDWTCIADSAVAATGRVYPFFPRRVVLVSLDLWILFGIVIAISVLASLAGIIKALKTNAGEILS